MICFLLLLSVTISAAAWYNHYEKALKAAKKEQWNSVIRCIQAALEEKKEPRLNARTVGIRFLDYLPYYYLGLAHYHKGNFKAARSAFERSLRCGAVKKRASLYGTLQDMLEECGEKLQAESRSTILVNKAIDAGDKFKKQGNLPAARSEYIKAQTLIGKTGEQAARLDELQRKLKEVSRLEKTRKSISEAEKLYQEQKYTKAESILKDVLREEPDNKPARRLLEQIDGERTREETRRQQESEPARTHAPAEAAENTLVQEGKRLYLAGKFKESREKFFAVLQFKANHRAARQWLANIDLALAVQKLNTGIRYYFKGDLVKSERVFRETIKTFSHLGDSKARKPLITAYQFLAVVLIDKHYLHSSSGNCLQEARQYIAKIFSIEPNFRLKVDFFSPKVVREFSR